MKIIILVFSCFLFMSMTYSQNKWDFKDSIASYFKEVKTVTKKEWKLWDEDLYGPILMVSPFTREVYSNYPDSAGVLKKDGKIYSGRLPSSIVVANYSLNWNGTNWAMIALVPALFKIDHHDVISLFGHELFHRAQPSLHFPRTNDPGNVHLDKKEGRIYLRLELAALRKALQSDDAVEIKKHIENAFLFRKYRYSLYPGSDSTENILDLNEGMAEYTGCVISQRNRRQAVLHFEEQADKFIQNPTYVRTFSYNTIPEYGYLLQRTNKYWNKRINAKTNLTEFFVHEFKISFPADIGDAVSKISLQYDGPLVFKEESAREEKREKLISEYKKKFIEQPHLEIGFQRKNVSFDPGNLVPIENGGTVYPAMEATDIWGALTVKNGALISTDGNKVTITPPLKIEGTSLAGDGWTLSLNKGFTVIKDETNGNYELRKQ